MKISVIIVNYNVQYFLEQALLSVRKALHGIDGEVWVVDNNSVDGSVEMVRQKFPEVHLIANKDNVGFSRANNQAIREAKGEYVLLLNPDTVVEEDTFIKVCGFMDKRPEAGALGVKMIDGKGHFLPESKRGLPSPMVAFYKLSGLSRLFPKSRVFGKYHLAYLDKEQTHEVEVLAGAFMLLRKSALDKVGLLDESFFMYGEDIDLSYRIIKGGYKNYYFADTTIIHYKGESTKKTSVNYVFVFYQAMVIFAKKHFSSSNATIFGLFINMAIWFRAGVALFQRFINRAWQPLLDGTLLFGLSWLLKRYWEENSRQIEGGAYPPEYLYVNVVVYCLCWILGMYSAGTYRKDGGLKNLVVGMLGGTIAIAVLYAFAPAEFRFSRALIILGAGFGSLVLLSYRLFTHFIRFRSFNYGDRIAYNTVVVGNKEEAQRVKKLLQQSNVPHTFLGFVRPGDSSVGEEVMGRLDQLEEIVTIFKVTEVIFCAGDVPSAEIIRWMARLSQSEVNFKIVPEESLYIIGSNSKNTNGELYTIELKLSLAEPGKTRQKRIFDLISSLSLLILLPLMLLVVRNKGGFLRNCWRVFLGKATWVGYASANSHSSDLPSLPPGILHPAGTADLSRITVDPALVNFRYARDYRPQNDLQILLSYLQELGKEAGN